MKTLIQNYASALSTESMYFYRSLCEIGYGPQTHLWTDQNQSTFDTFDYVKPDIFISHYRFLTIDIIKYLSQNPSILMALNVTGASQDNIDTLENLIETNKINIPFVFTNLYECTNNLSPKKLELKYLHPATDVFLPIMPTPNYELNTCYFSLENNDILNNLKSKEEQYHIVSFNQPSEDRYADMYLDITQAYTFYNKYKQCVLVGDINFVTSQALYDCIVMCKSISTHVPKEQEHLLSLIFSQLFDEESEEDVSSLIKKQVKTKHNCVNRTAKLFRMLNAKEVANSLEKLSERITYKS